MDEFTCLSVGGVATGQPVDRSRPPGQGAEGVEELVLLAAALRLPLPIRDVHGLVALVALVPLPPVPLVVRQALHRRPQVCHSASGPDAPDKVIKQ
eukprot:1184957-Prorocentrum_minimum.AAC.2